jgi:hypothetical protein
MQPNKVLVPDTVTATPELKSTSIFGSEPRNSETSASSDRARVPGAYFQYQIAPFSGSLAAAWARRGAARGAARARPSRILDGWTSFHSSSTKKEKESVRGFCRRRLGARWMCWVGVEVGIMVGVVGSEQGGDEGECEVSSCQRCTVFLPYPAPSSSDFRGILSA